MKILVLGDVMGLSGRTALKKNLSNIITEKKIDFSVINGENAADDGKGIKKNRRWNFFSRDRCNNFWQSYLGQRRYNKIYWKRTKTFKAS